ncbi:MAG TPA: glutamyl-tRNA reductase, partial [Puia sp.]|nr:glutamyl-tRNA reductase [Puia sp.]
DQYEKIVRLAPSFNVTELFVLSTCNRTEIYGFADNSAHLAALLCTQTTGDLGSFMDLAYIRKGEEAIQHLFEVGAGLDSQILGDYEIVGQIKQAVKFARDRQATGPFTERLVNCVLQASKAIKNQTGLSGGTVSVSFAAIQYIRERIADPERQRILLIGTGKIGRNTCRNIVDYLGTRNITLINRTESKAAELAAEIGVSHAPVVRIAECVRAADIILVATNAEQPTLLGSWLEGGKGRKLVIDLSIPCNVEPAAAELPGVTLVNVDELSKIKDETLQKREAEVPKAKAIIAEHLAEWIDWFRMRQHVPVLRAVKSKLKELHTCPVFSRLQGEPFPATDQTDEQIQRVINGMASKMRQHNQGGCHFIEAINEYIAATN